MVSVKNFESAYPLWKQTSGSEQSKYSQVPFKGNLHAITVPVYRFGTKPAQDNGCCGGLPCAYEKGQSLLDSFLLSQWEDRAWRGLLRYDVTSCETKVINGRKKFVAQLNENWNLNFMEPDNEILSPLEGFKFSCLRINREDLLFCVASGDKGSPELIHSVKVPNNAILVIINANPVEYGHVFLVPCSSHHPSQFLDKRSLQLITQIAVEINDSSFRVFYDHKASSNSSNIHFQACYFADVLPVERMPVIPVFDELLEKKITICEVVDYPVKALVFMGEKDLSVLVEVVSEICSCLWDQNTPFNLLISDCGAKIFLFPQVHTLGAGINLSAWECGGHFVFKASRDFDLAAEDNISKRMAALSLEDKCFQTVKLLCCSIARKIIS